jgi:hypothetical protein
MAMISEQISEAMAAVMELAHRRGVTKINELPGCWEIQVDSAWWLAVNGHRETTKCSKGTEVLPFHAYVEFNGWPAGIFNPYGGTMAAGTVANEDAFIAAVKAA